MVDCVLKTNYLSIISITWRFVVVVAVAAAAAAAPAGVIVGVAGVIVGVAGVIVGVGVGQFNYLHCDDGNHSGFGGCGSMVLMVVLLMTLPVWSRPFHVVHEHYEEVIMIRRTYHSSQV